ncbi:hypothetical protein FGG08_000614 [Glutinoglossum americanum]|uniref:Opi1-domain-containing protein n=1 Tax=Glutinoglossum americanum TaxID=1670608 RepID=A0A9P8ICW4_9PEZI|nr:hypothetical protein FGG08_000614 [Glutinoglossum americanum]
MSAQQQELPPLHELPAYSSPQFHDPRILRLPSVPSIDPLPPPRIVSSTAETPRQSKTSLSPSIKPPQYQQQQPPHQRSLSIKDLISTPPAENTQVQPQHQYFPVFPHQALPPISSPVTNNGAEADLTSSGDLESIVSASERSLRAGSVLSMEDPDVRIAAEALGDLRADFVASPPPQRSNPSVDSSQPGSEHAGNDARSQPEPLLSLLTSTHPLLSTAIHGSISAYSSSKSYSPRFKYGAEFVERHIGSPVASTVGSVGRRTGVEGGVRWWLGRRGSGQQEGGGTLQNQAEDEAEESASKRRKVDRDEKSHLVDIEMGLSNGYQLPQIYNQQRRPSQASFAESLPAYDDHKSPSYELTASSLVPAQQIANQPTQNPNWQTRLMLSTSGLGVAMSEESLRSLKYCLTWLRWANVHLGKVIVALKNVVEEWDQSQQHHHLQQQPREQGRLQQDRQEPPRYSITNETNNDEPNNPDPTTNSNQQHDTSALLLPPPSQPTDTSLIHVPAPLSPTQSEALARRIHDLKSDVLSTLKKVVDIVSTYAGGALPDNARLLVRKHLTSLPQRFHLASSSSPSIPPSSTSPAPNSNGANEGVSKDIAINRISGEAIGSAQRVLVLAREGLDMMAQVSGVLDGTIVRAEEWCERLGKKKREEGDVAVGAEEGRSVEGGKEGLDVEDKGMAISWGEEKVQR